MVSCAIESFPSTRASIRKEGSLLRNPGEGCLWGARIILMSSSSLVQESFGPQLCSCQQQTWQECLVLLQRRPWHLVVRIQLWQGGVRVLGDVYFSIVGPGERELDRWTSSKVLKLLDSPFNSGLKDGGSRGRSGQEGGYTGFTNGFRVRARALKGKQNKTTTTTITTTKQPKPPISAREPFCPRNSTESAHGKFLRHAN